MVVENKCFVWSDMVFGWTVRKWSCCNGLDYEVCGFGFGLVGFPTKSFCGSSNLGCKFWSKDLLLSCRISNVVDFFFLYV